MPARLTEDDMIEEHSLDMSDSDCSNSGDCCRNWSIMDTLPAVDSVKDIRPSKMDQRPLLWMTLPWSDMEELAVSSCDLAVIVIIVSLASS